MVESGSYLEEVATHESADSSGCDAGRRPRVLPHQMGGGDMNTTLSVEELEAHVKEKLDDGATARYLVTHLEIGFGLSRQVAEFVVQQVSRCEPLSEEALYDELSAAEDAAEQDPNGVFLISAVASAIGGGVTWGTFTAADPGDTVYILWGPTVFGAWMFLRGGVRLLRYPTGRGLALGMVALGLLAASGLALGLTISQ